MAYRREEHPARYICVVCWQMVSSTQSVCSRDGAPLQAIESDDLTILTELRRRAREKKERPGRRHIFAASIAAFISSIVLHGFLIGYRVYDLDARRGGWGGTSNDGVVGLAFMATFGVLLAAYYYLFRSFGFFKRVPGSETFDPEAAGADSLADWLGLKVDEAGGAR